MLNPYEIPNLRFSVPAGAAITWRRFVTVNAAGAGVFPAAGAPAIGVSMNEAKSGEVLDVADGIVMVEAAGSIAAGALISTDADGKATPATAQTQSGTTPYAVTAGTVVLGVALTSAAAAGQPIAVKMN